MSRYSAGSVAREPKETITVSRGKWYQQPLDVTTDTDTTFWTRHEVLGGSHSFRLVYGNFYQDDDPARLSRLEPYPLEVVLEVVMGGQTRLFDVTWGNDGTQTTVQPGRMVISDPIGLLLKRGDTFRIRTHVTSATGGKFPYNITTNAANGEGKAAGNHLRDATLPNSATLAALGPLAILATPVKPFEVVACVGDSISLGAGNDLTNTDNHLVGEVGFMQLAAMRTGRGYITLGMNGQATDGFVEFKRHRRMLLADKCTIAICNYGTNDMTVTTRPLSEIQANLLDMWEALSLRGLKVYQTTITPRTNAKDKWATEGQVPINDRTVGGTASVRSQLNDWIRTKPSPHLAGVIDAASAVETGLNTGLWQDDKTSDGIHPSGAGHSAIAEITVAAIGGS